MIHNNVITNTDTNTKSTLSAKISYSMENKTSCSGGVSKGDAVCCILYYRGFILLNYLHRKVSNAFCRALKF